MSLSLILGCLWVLASAVVALLPMRLQFVPGIALLLAAPPLLVYLATQHSPWLVLAGVFAFVSMFRNPLRYFLKRALGQPVELPAEFRKTE